MKSAALGIGYLIWCRHKRGFIASAAGLAAMAIVYPVLFAYTRVLSAVVLSTIPLIAIFGFVLNACLFTEEPGSMVSSYPKSLFALPVRSGALAFWPMFSGSAIAALLWIVTAGVIYPLSGFRPPVWIPAVGLATLVGWFQGMAWMPLAARWLRRRGRDRHDPRSQCTSHLAHPDGSGCERLAVQFAFSVPRRIILAGPRIRRHGSTRRLVAIDARQIPTLAASHRRGRQAHPSSV